MKNNNITYRYTMPSGGGTFDLETDQLIERYVITSTSIDFTAALFAVQATGTIQKNAIAIIDYIGAGNTENASSDTITILGTTISDAFLNMSFTAYAIFNGASWDVSINVSSNEAGYITETSILTGAVTGLKIPTGTILEAHMSANSVNTAAIKALNVNSTHLAAALFLGNGIELSGTALSINLATSPGLEINASKELTVKTSAPNCIELTTDGVEVLVPVTETAITKSSTGLTLKSPADYFEQTVYGLEPVIKMKTIITTLSQGEVELLYSDPKLIVPAVSGNYINILSVVGIVKTTGGWASNLNLRVYSGSTKSEYMFESVAGLGSDVDHIFTFIPTDKATTRQIPPASDIYLTGVTSDPSGGTDGIKIKVIYEEIPVTSF